MTRLRDGEFWFSVFKWAMIAALFLAAIALPVGR